MTILFTEEEKRYLAISTDGDYRLTFKNGTPERIAESIRKKTAAHRQAVAESKKGGEAR